MSNALNKMTAELWILRTTAMKREKKEKIKITLGQPEKWALYFKHSEVFCPCKLYRSKRNIYMHYCTNECRWVRMCACVVSERTILWMYTYMDMFKWTGMEIFEIPNHRWKRVSSLIRSTLSYTLQTLDLMVRWHQILLNKNRDTLRSSHKGKSTILTVPKTFENE